MDWQEATTPEGRKYWFNSRTQQSVWEKPSELKTPQEKAIDTTSWKEYETKGRKYYVHNETKETTWDMPEEVKKALESVPAAPAPTPVPAASTPLATSASNPGHASTPLGNSSGSISTAAGGGALVVGSMGGGYSHMSSIAPVAQNTPLYFGSTEEAQAAFIDMLKNVGVKENWTWEQVLKQIINQPLYKALHSTDERKAAFEKYLAELRKKDQERKLQALDRMRPIWREGLSRAAEKQGGGMKSWWSWERTRNLLQDRYADMWSTLKTDDDRRTLWQEYIGELQRKEKMIVEELRKRNMSKLKLLFGKLDIGLDSDWRSTRRTIEKSKDWVNDGELQQIDPIEILSFYEEHVKKLETEATETRLRQKEEKRRRVRKNREGFVQLLQELKADNKIVWSTTWADIYPLVKDDDRYKHILGNPGSTPLELFWDIVDELTQAVEEQCRIVEVVLAEKKKAVTVDTTWEQFVEILASDGIPSRVKDVDEQGRRNVYDMLHQRFVRVAKEEKRRQEKKTRQQMDDLRYALRKVDPEIGPDATWEETLPLISELPQFVALKNEDARKQAFDKHIERQKERKAAREEQESRRSRHMSEDVKSQGSPRRRDRHVSRDARARSTSHKPEAEDVTMDEEVRDRDRSSRKRSVSPSARDSDRSSRRKREDYEKTSRSSRHDEDRHSSSGRRSSRYDDRDRERQRDRNRDRERSGRDRDRKRKATSRSRSRSRQRTRHERRPSEASSTAQVLGYGSPLQTNSSVVEKEKVEGKEPKGDREEGEI